MKNATLRIILKWNLSLCLIGCLISFNPFQSLGQDSSSESQNVFEVVDIQPADEIFLLVDTNISLSEKDIIFKDSARLAIEQRTRLAYRRSMFVPGWGQITNGGIWWIKVPVIYGGFVTAGLVIEFNNRYYQSILKDVQYRLANNHAMPPNSPYDYIAADPQGTQYLISAKDYYRRNRDITMFITLGWYALNIIEAYVDSMLKFRWEVGDDLQARWTPTVIPIHPGQSNQVAMGMSLKFNINQKNK